MKYLQSLKIERGDIFYIMALLCYEEATIEMLMYIAETQDENLTTLTATALKLSKKYGTVNET